MLIDTHDQFAGAASTPLLGNPVVPVMGARVRHAIDCLSADEIGWPGGDRALARVADQVRLTPLAIDTRSARWHAGASDCDGRPGLKVEVVLDYAGDRSLFAVLPWGVDSAPVTIASDTSLIVTALGVVENPEDLIAPLRETIELIERSVAVQELHVAQANAAIVSLAAILLRRRVRRDAVAEQFRRSGSAKTSPRTARRSSVA